MKSLLKSILVILPAVLALSLAQTPVKAGDTLKDENGASIVGSEKTSAVSISDPSVSPYVTMSWPGMDKPAYGVGTDINFNLTKNLGLAFFGESDDPGHAVIDRAGAGLRYTAYAGSRLSLDGGIQGCYDIEGSHGFVRLPLGVSFNLMKSKSADLSIRAVWAFDISGDGKHGTATGRASIGPTFTFKF